MNRLFKFGTYGHTLETRRELYRGIEKTLAIRVPTDVDDYRLVARLNVQQVIKGLDHEISRQFDLHPEDRQ